VEGSDAAAPVTIGRPATHLRQASSQKDSRNGQSEKIGPPRPLFTVGGPRIINPEEFQLADHLGSTAIRLRTLMVGDSAGVLHVTAASGGEGVSTVARELVYAASRMQWCKALLLDGNAGDSDQSHALGGPIPDIVTGYAEHGDIEVTSIESEGTAFHAARWPANVSSNGMAVIPVLSRLLRAAYDLIVVDCPPILAYPHLPPVSAGMHQVLLVVRSETSSARLVQRARQEIDTLRGNIWGAVLTGQRQLVPRALDARI
jgi:Mrp family chromosome partitioning ATPase